MTRRVAAPASEDNETATVVRLDVHADVDEPKVIAAIERSDLIPRGKAVDALDHDIGTQERLPSLTCGKALSELLERDLVIYRFDEPFHRRRLETVWTSS